MTHILLTLILATLITQGGVLFATLRRLAVIEELLLDDLDDDGVTVIPAHDLPEEIQDTIAEHLRSIFRHPSMRNRHPENDHNDDGPGFL